MLAIQDQLTLKKMLKAEMLSLPFKHLIVSNVFSTQTYHNMIQNFPKDEQFSSSVKKFKGRMILKDHKSEFWQLFQERFFGREFMSRLMNRFDVRLDQDDGIEIDFVKDGQGYSIGPHTDTKYKKFSMLCYLPEDRSIQRYGTAICSTTNQSLLDREDHFPWSNEFEESHTTLFVPNTIFCFARTSNSFHGVHEITEDIVRRSVVCSV